MSVGRKFVLGSGSKFPCLIELPGPGLKYVLLDTLEICIYMKILGVFVYVLDSLSKLHSFSYYKRMDIAYPVGKWM